MGTMTFGGGGKFAAVGTTGVEEARAQIDMCLDAGVNLIDTADVYSDGASEEIVGQVLKTRRDEVLLTTKVRFAMGDGPNDAGLSRHHIVSACEASLRRLGTDYLDLYQLHEWDGLTPLEETLEALDLLVSSGKVRYVGASNFSAWHLMKALGVSERAGLPRLVSQQIYYSLQGREAEYELVPLAIDQQPPEGARHLGDWNEPPVYDEESLYDVVDVLVEIAAARGVPAAQVALAFTLGRPGVTSLVVGARTREQLAQNLAAVELVLDDGERDRLEKVSRPPLPYPYWHQAATASDRLSPADLTLLGPHLP